MNVIQYRICSSYAASWLQSPYKKMTYKYTIGPEVNWSVKLDYCPVIDWREPKSFLLNASVPCKKTGCHFLALCGPARFNLYLCRWASRRVPGTRCHPPLRSGSDSPRERIYREYSQSAKTMFNSRVSIKVVQLNRFRYKMTILKSMTMLLLWCTLYGIENMFNWLYRNTFQLN